MSKAAAGMIFDWDLWPIALDQRWVYAESARRLAAAVRHLALALDRLGFTVQLVTAEVERFAEAYRKAVTP